MFSRKSDDEAKGAEADPVEAENADDADESLGSAPPLKPFSRKGSHAPAKPPATPYRAEIPRRPVEIPGAPRRDPRPRTAEDGSKKLTVGRDICLSGEITACDKLVVEGRVDAHLTDARIIEVAPSGVFKGSANVQEADISGRYEGDITAQVKLVVRASGRIEGTVRYGRLVVEAGGEITGRMEVLAKAEETDRYEPAATEAEPADGDA